MSNFSVPVLVAAVAATYKTGGALFVTATARRMMVYEAEMGQQCAAAGYASTDISCQWDISRFGVTNALAGTSVAAGSYDPADSAAAAGFLNLVTAEPTYTTAGNGLTLKSWAINQRGSYRWRALDDGDNIIIPATAAFGVGIRTLSAGFAVTAVGSMSFVER